MSSCSLVTGLAVVATTLVLTAPVGADGDASPHRSEPGTVETVAGPGFCEGQATLDPTSEMVRALAVDGTGRIHVDTGPPSKGVVARIDGGTLRLLSTGFAGPLPASSANLNRQTAPSASRLANDGTGGVLVATERGILQVSEMGVAPVAGQPDDTDIGTVPASTGDGGPARQAGFRRVLGLASDEAGNVYVADEVDRGAGTFRIRFVNRSPHPVTFYPGSGDELTVAPGSIDTIAGGSTKGDGWSEGAERGRAGSAALVGLVPALAWAGDRLYIASTRPARPGFPLGGRIQMINLGGGELVAHGVLVAPAAIVTVADGARDQTSAADRGGASTPSFSYLPGIAADRDGNLYLADQAGHRILRVDPTGSVTTFAGTGVPGFNGNDHPAAEARFNQPFDVEVGPGGTVYISDQRNSQVRFVDRAGLVHAAPGNGIALAWVCEGGSLGPPTLAPVHPRVGNPSGVATDGEGNAYVALPALGQVKKLDSFGSLTTLAGKGLVRPACPPQVDCPAGGDGGPAGEARLSRPQAVETAPGGGLYILDAGDARVRFVNLGPRPLRMHGVTVAPGTIRTVAGSGTYRQDGDGGDGGSAVSAKLSLNAIALAADTEGNLFIADGERVRQVDGEGVITTFVGRDENDTSGCCFDPTGLAMDQEGNLYVGDAGLPRVWLFNRGRKEITAHGQTVAPGTSVVVAGDGTRGVGGDGGPATDAQFFLPRGVAVDGQGNLYITDHVADHTIRRVDATGVMSTALGTGQVGFNGDGLKGPLTNLFSPMDVALDRCGNVLVADHLNDRVRRLRTTESCGLPASQAGLNPGRDVRRGFVPALLVLLGLLCLALAARVARRLRPYERG